VILLGLLTPRSADFTTPTIENTEAPEKACNGMNVWNEKTSWNKPLFIQVSTFADIVGSTTAVDSATTTIAILPEDPLISCLIKHESSGNEKRINPRDSDGNPAYGLLQFHEDTFREWCVQKYGFDDDIFSGKIQYYCAKLMIGEGQLWRWPTARKYCL
jgi:hypothetical protein